MFTATGLGVRKNPNLTITVRVQVVDDRTQRVIDTLEYTGPTVVNVIGQIRADLQARANAETDATLTAAVVGQVLGTV